MAAIPVARVPAKSGIRIPVEIKLKPGWRYVASRRAFESSRGERFAPRSDLPKNSRIVYKVPKLAEADTRQLSRHERELSRYMQVILPAGEAPENYVKAIGAWPCVAEVQVGPDVSLPR
jgi:hypothetical protein